MIMLLFEIVLKFLILLLSILGIVTSPEIGGVPVPEYYLIQRPTVYSGMQTIDAHPVLFGMVFHDYGEERGGFLKLREVVDYSDRINYKVIRNTPTKFGHIEMKDDLHHSLQMDAKWVKLNDKSFAYRVSCTEEGGGEPEVSVYLYLSSTDGNVQMHVDGGTGEISGSTTEFGNFKLSTVSYEGGGDEVFHFGNYTPNPFFASDEIEWVLIKGVEGGPEDSPGCCYPLNHARKLPNFMGNDPNMIVIQKILKTPFEWTVKFENVDTPPPSFDFDQKFNEYSSDFDSVFKEKFPVTKFLDEMDPQEGDDSDWEEFGKRVLSALLNGLSFFEGDSWIYDPVTEKKWKIGNRRLLTLIPGKVGFPRGFYWDEGFHQIVMERYSSLLHEEVTKYWYNLQNETTGWIAREQIIGEECFYTAPEWAWYGHLDQMNPPAFFLAHERYLKLNSSAVSFLSQMFPKYKATYYWYLNNLEANQKFTYHWNGRIGSGDSALDSGLDDYPRFFKFDESEKNVDLQAWLAKISLIMRDFAHVLGDQGEYEEFDYNYKQIWGNLKAKFWSDEDNFYVDINGNAKSQHIGTNGALAFCLELEDDETRINQFISKMSDDFDSNFGILSLSKYDKNFIGNYWRGNIWINMNYICLRALKNYEGQGFDVKDLRKKFQYNIALNMYKNYFDRADGAVFETFHPVTGRGYNHHPFAGWSSLVLLIMSEDYV